MVAQEGTEPFKRYEETGCAVQGSFLEFFESRGGLEIFGYPLTEPFWQGGIRVQYFQKARFESHPDHPPLYQVQLGLLADELNYRNPARPRQQPDSSTRHYFPETGHTVSLAFLRFFKEHGGIDIFGYPLTEMYYEEGRIVQYFQRMKLAWYPTDSKSPVHIEDLGELYLRTRTDHFPPESNCNGHSFLHGEQASQLEVVVSIRHSVLEKGEDTQTVSILVRDGQGEPFPNAKVTLTLRNTAKETLFELGNLFTDERGFLRLSSIPVQGVSAGENVTVEVLAAYGGIQGIGSDVFLVW
ncbi:MAG: hypothetical protein U9Q70_02325 [Chloroflexota bacterium]|nr:hypothetical protein [Chloroflexota bacterium]